jgi:L-ascorbate metabolism protein UlaG (beta-lactamase superfamily)
MWEGIEFRRTGGRHGTGEIGAAMVPVSGFVLHTPDEPTLYIAGDTIWCPEVEDALTEYQPQVTVVKAGAARFVAGDPITMSGTNVAEVCHYAPGTTVVAVHMEAINHCLLSRNDLQALLDGENLSQRVRIPADGERMNFS